MIPGHLVNRSGEARTHDPHVPNVVRYQLRYTPMCSFLHAKVIVRYLFLICKKENENAASASRWRRVLQLCGSISLLSRVPDSSHQQALQVLRILLHH
jgi:hypothetical protein